MCIQTIYLIYTSKPKQILTQNDISNEEKKINENQ